MKKPSKDKESFFENVRQFCLGFKQGWVETGKFLDEQAKNAPEGIIKNPVLFNMFHGSNL